MDDDALRVWVKWGDDGHDGPGFYVWEEDYPDEGSAGAFPTRESAEAFALGLADLVEIVD